MTSWPLHTQVYCQRILCAASHPDPKSVLIFLPHCPLFITQVRGFMTRRVTRRCYAGQRLLTKQIELVTHGQRFGPLGFAQRLSRPHEGRITILF